MFPGEAGRIAREEEKHQRKAPKVCTSAESRRTAGDVSSNKGVAPHQLTLTWNPPVSSFESKKKSMLGGGGFSQLAKSMSLSRPLCKCAAMLFGGLQEALLALDRSREP